MDNAQKKKALEKIDSFILLTAYPDELLNDTKINLYYQSLELTGGNYLESSLNVSLFRTLSSLVRLPADKDEWKIIGIAEDISASYHFDLNAMCKYILIDYVLYMFRIREKLFFFPRKIFHGLFSRNHEPFFCGHFFHIRESRQQFCSYHFFWASRL